MVADARALAFDPARNAIWYTSMNEQGPAQLYEANSSTGRTEAQFTLPDAASTGLFSVVRVAGDGSVWVAEPYALVRVDPATSSVTAIDLPVAVTGTIKDAPDPGTWISAMTVTSDSVLVGRDNLPFLQQWSLGLQPEADVPLPPGDSGPESLTTTKAGVEIAFANNPTLEADAGKTVAVALSNGTGSQPDYLSVMAPTGVALQRFDGTQIVAVDPASHTLDWITPAGGTGRIPWPATSVIVHGPPSPRHPTGSDVHTFTEDQLLAALVTPSGDLWIVKGDGGTSSSQLEEYSTR